MNSIDVNDTLLCSASDDCSVKVWDSRSKYADKSFSFGSSMTSVAISGNSSYLFCGGIDNQIRAINLRMNKLEYTLVGHTDTLTDICLSNQGNTLLSNSMDNTLKLWDVSPYIQES